MFRYNLILLPVILVICSFYTSSGEIESTFSYNKIVQQILPYVYNTFYSIDQPLIRLAEKVNIQLYYECFCRSCRDFDTTQFKGVIEKLSKYLNIQTYPYGNAETIEVNGKYVFKCQHGPKECYGNKLHACALDIIQNQTQALLYNSCMMNFTYGYGSDDKTADECAALMKIDSNSIKACAKGLMGSKLLNQYGDESRRANFNYVPYILVNGKETDGSNFMRVVCAAYANPPPPCTQFV